MDRLDPSRRATEVGKNTLIDDDELLKIIEEGGDKAEEAIYQWMCAIVENKCLNDTASDIEMISHDSLSANDEEEDGCSEDTPHDHQFDSDEWNDDSIVDGSAKGNKGELPQTIEDYFVIARDSYNSLADAQSRSEFICFCKALAGC